MKAKITTGLAARIALSGVGKCGGAAAKQKRTQLAVSFKSTSGAQTKAKKTNKLKT
jgi:hypothetical protein